MKNEKPERDILSIEILYDDKEDLNELVESEDFNKLLLNEAITSIQDALEKGEDKADTVGICTLRKEHVKLEPETHTVILDFLGKDSMQHFEKYHMKEKYGDIGVKVFNNFKKFTDKKKPDEQVLDKLTPKILNEHLNSLMQGLTAKVFRTYNASSTLQNYLDSTIKGGD